MEIGDWERSRYQLSRADAGAFVLSAEGVDLTFRPNHPDEFATAATRGMTEAPKPASRRRKLQTDAPEDAPPAKPLTLVLFYLLVAGTVGMLVWALTSIIS